MGSSACAGPSTGGSGSQASSADFGAVGDLTTSGAEVGRSREVGKVFTSGRGPMGSSSPSSVMRTSRRGSGRGAKRMRRALRGAARGGDGAFGVESLRDVWDEAADAEEVALPGEDESDAG